MRNLILAMLFLSAYVSGQVQSRRGNVAAVPQVSDATFISETVYPAVALLYAESAKGSLEMLCTVTMIEKTSAGYVGATAAHCASEDDEDHERVDVAKKDFLITFDESKDKKFIPAKVMFCGYQHIGDDACLFEITTDKVATVVPLGVDPSEHSGETIINIASPLGLGKQVFHGTISSPKLERAVVVDDINWKNAMLLQIPGTNGGSSGSAVVCTAQRAICGFLVGTIAETEVVAIPVSRLINLRKKIETKTYKYWKPGESVE